MPLPLTHSIQLLGLLVRPGEAARWQPDRGRVAVHQAVLREQLADQLVVLLLPARGAVHPPVELPDHLGLGDAERGVQPVAVERRPGRVDAERRAEAAEQLARVGAALRHGDQVDALGRDADVPVGQDGRQVEGPVEPRVPELDAVQEAPVGPLAALLDALLPGGRQRAGEVAGGVHDVHLAAREVAHRARDHLRRRRREDLVADDAGAGAGGEPLGQLPPGAVGVAGLPAPVLAEQVERRAELEQLRGDQRVPRREVHVVAGQALHVPREPVLEVRRPRLRRTDVQVDDPAHGADCGGPLRSAGEAEPRRRHR